MENQFIPEHNTVIDFNVYVDVAENKMLLNSLIHQWISLYNKNNRTSYQYVDHDIVDGRLKQHKKVNIKVSFPPLE